MAVKMTSGKKENTKSSQMTMKDIRALEKELFRPPSEKEKMKMKKDEQELAKLNKSIEKSQKRIEKMYVEAKKLLKNNPESKSLLKFLKKLEAIYEGI